MTKDLLIGIDAGTSVIKAVVFNLQGDQIAIASRPNTYSTPGPGQVEQDMLQTWVDCAATLRDLHDIIPDIASRVVALSVTGQGDGTWLIDEDGEPIGGGLLWLDSRAANIVTDYLKKPPYADHYFKTGSGLNACMASAQIAWLKAHQPERLQRAHTAFHCKDWLYYRLTGERVSDPSESNFTFGNFRTRQYESSVLDNMGIGEYRRLLAPIIDGSQTYHGLSPAAAAVTGLPQGLPVTLAYLDVICTALGGGLYDRTGTVGLSIFGTTGMHMRYAASPDAVRLSDDRSGYTMCFPVPGASASLQSNMAATLNIDWFLDVARGAAEIAGASVDRSTFLKGMDERVLNASSHGVIYHPYIFEAGERGPFLDPNARAQFVGLSTKTSFADMMRAVYEGLALASRDCYLATGSIPSEVRLGGGAARSKAIRVILASALGAQVRTVKREETGAAGAAMMAAVCLNIYPDIPACADAWVTPSFGETTAPNAELNTYYTKLYDVYHDIRASMPPQWAHLAQIRQEQPA